MHFTRPALLLVAGCSLILNQPLRAQAPPWTPDKQFSADENLTMKSGMTATGRTYKDNDKIRSEMTINGRDLVSIVRLDEQKLYSVLPEQKMVMEMPLSPDKVKEFAAMNAGPNSKIDLVGPDVAEGAPCLKYKMTTTTDNKAYYWWINAATKVPVKFASEDGNVSVTFTNYKAGPQDASLFEPPAGYQVMEMPSGMGAPGGGAPPPGQ